MQEEGGSLLLKAASHCCDTTPEENQLTKEGFTVAYSWQLSIILRDSEQEEFATAGSSQPQSENRHTLVFRSLLFIQSGTPAWRMVSCTIRVDRPPQPKNSFTDTQRVVHQVNLEPATLTVVMNRHVANERTC